MFLLYNGLLGVDLFVYLKLFEVYCSLRLVEFCNFKGYLEKVRNVLKGYIIFCEYFKIYIKKLK